MRHLLMALGIVSWMILGACPRAFAQDSGSSSKVGNPNIGRPSDDSAAGETSDDRDGTGQRRVSIDHSRHIDLNERRIRLPGSDEEGYDAFFGFSDFLVGGGGSTVLDAGDEFYSKSGFGFAQAGFRHVGWGQTVHLQLGLRAFADGALFQSHDWRGRIWRAGGGPEIALFPVVAEGEMPRWSAILRPMFSYVHEQGSSRVSGYKLYGQNSLMFNFQGWIELYPFIPDDDWAFDRLGYRFKRGWFPAFQFRTDADVMISASRSSTETRQGRKDPKVNQSRFAETAIFYIRRSGTALGLLDWGPSIGFEFRHAAGYKTLDLNDTTLIVNGGVAVRAQPFPDIFLYANAGANYEVDTGRVGAYASVSVEFLGLMEGLEHWIRTPSRR